MQQAAGRPSEGRVAARKEGKRPRRGKGGCRKHNRMTAMSVRGRAPAFLSTSIFHLLSATRSAQRHFRRLPAAHAAPVSQSLMATRRDHVTSAWWSQARQAVRRAAETIQRATNRRCNRRQAGGCLFNERLLALAHGQGERAATRVG